MTWGEYDTQYVHYSHIQNTSGQRMSVKGITWNLLKLCTYAIYLSTNNITRLQ